MTGRIFKLAGLTFAAVSLTLMLVKHFGASFDVSFDPAGLAASAIYPLAILGAVLAGLGNQFDRSKLNRENTNA